MNYFMSCIKVFRFYCKCNREVDFVGFLRRRVIRFRKIFWVGCRVVGEWKGWR